MRRTTAPGAARRSRPPRPVALTGTPGTGKSAVARLLAPRWSVAEVADLALEFGAGRQTRAGVDVDLARLSRRLRARSAELPSVVVGHLAHLLPIPDAIVLRCHPVELDRRLARARRGTALQRRENVEAEATDVVLLEAIGLDRRVWELDTTGRSVASVGRSVSRLLTRPPAPRTGTVDWLADPAVTDFLLRPAR